MLSAAGGASYYFSNELLAAATRFNLHPAGVKKMIAETLMNARATAAVLYQLGKITSRLDLDPSAFTKMIADTLMNAKATALFLGQLGKVASGTAASVTESLKQLALRQVMAIGTNNMGAFFPRLPSKSILAVAVACIITAALHNRRKPTTQPMSIPPPEPLQKTLNPPTSYSLYGDVFPGKGDLIDETVLEAGASFKASPAKNLEPFYDFLRLAVTKHLLNSGSFEASNILYDDDMIREAIEATKQSKTPYTSSIEYLVEKIQKQAEPKDTPTPSNQPPQER